METTMEKNKGNLYFLLFSGVVLCLFYGFLKDLFALAWSNNSNSHILFIPFVSIWLIYTERAEIFANPGPVETKGGAFLVVGVLLFAGSRWTDLNISPNDRVSMGAFALVTLFAGGFLLCHGYQALRTASFPFLFLLFMVPLPDFLLNALIGALQWASAETVNVLFQAVGISFFREGDFTFQFAGLAIEVAKECSGIRSSWSLFIISVLAGHFFLKFNRNRLILALSVFPITVFKNAVRIASLSLLSIYVDRGFLTGNLHRVGGIPFFVAAVVLLGIVSHLLRRLECNNRKFPAHRM